MDPPRGRGNCLGWGLLPGATTVFCCPGKYPHPLLSIGSQKDTPMSRIQTPSAGVRPPNSSPLGARLSLHLRSTPSCLSCQSLSLSLSLSRPSLSPTLTPIASVVLTSARVVYRPPIARGTPVKTFLGRRRLCNVMQTMYIQWKDSI